MECKPLLKKLEEICEFKFDSGDATSSNLDKDDSPISIPDFNPVPNLLPSIDDSLKKGEHVSPTISPVMPRKAVISQMDMPKYSEPSDQDGNIPTLSMSELDPEKKVDSLYLNIDTNKDTAVTESQSSLGPPLSDVSSESLNDSSTSGISKSSQPSETSIYLECSSASKPQMADSGYMENADVKNQDLTEHSNELALLLGSTSNDNTVSESTSKLDYTAKETTSTPIKFFEHCEQSFEQTKMFDPDRDGAPSHLEENNKIRNEPETEIESTETLTESEVKTANIFVENILESALSQHYGTVDPSIPSEPEIISSAFKVSTEDVEVTDSDSLARSQESALDDDVVVLSNSKEIQNDFGMVSQELKPLLTSEVTFFEKDTTITENESPVTLSEDDNVEELSEEEVHVKNTAILSKDVVPPEIETETTESITKQLKLEDEYVSQSESNSEMAALKTTLQDTSEEINEISNQMSKNSHEASDSSSGSSRNSLAMESFEMSLSESDNELDTKDLKTEVIMSDETLNDVASASLSKETISLNTVVSDINTTEETTNSNVVPETSASEELSGIRSSTPDIVDKFCTETLSEAQSDKAVLNVTELTTSVSVSDVVTSKTVSDESSTCTMELENPLTAEESESSVIPANTEMANSVPEVNNLISFPEIKEIPIQEVDDSIIATRLENSVLQANSAPEVKNLITLPEIKEIPIQELDDSIIAAELETTVIQPSTELANSVPKVNNLITLPEINEISIQELDNSIIAAGLEAPVIQPSTELANPEPEIKENTVQELEAPKSPPEINSEIQLTPDQDSLIAAEISDAPLEAKTAIKEDNVEEKEIDTELSLQEIEISLSSKDTENISFIDVSLQQYISNTDEISSEENAEKSSAKSRFTYHSFGYIVLGMAMVGSGMLLLHKYWK